MSADPDNACHGHRTLRNLSAHSAVMALWAFGLFTAPEVSRPIRSVGILSAAVIVKKETGENASIPKIHHDRRRSAQRAALV